MRKLIDPNSSCGFCGGYDLGTRCESCGAGSEMKFILSGEEKCWCHTCRPIDPRDPKSISMRLCPNCGNKRCPKATNHRNECTNSNEPNQAGSIY